MPPEGEELERIDLRPIATAAGSIVLAMAGSLFALWLWRPGWLWQALSATMKANTAVALALLAGALQASARDRRRLSLALAALVALLASATLFEYGAGRDLGVDQLFALDADNDESRAHPGRMAPNAALGLLTLALGSLCGQSASERLRRTARILAAGVGLGAGLALLGYVYGTTSFYRIGNAIRISPATATAQLLLAIGALCGANEGALAQALSARTAGGVMARRLILPVTAVPLFFDWLGTIGARRGLFDGGLAQALEAGSAMLALLVVVLLTARVLDRLDRGRLSALRDREAAAREAERAVEVRDEFINIAAHELRTPLTALKLRLQADERREQLGLLPRPPGQLVQVVRRDVERLERLVERMLDAARAAKGRLDLRHEVIDLTALVRETVDRLRPLFETSRIELTLTAAEGQKARGDALQLGQALENLLTNALRYGGSTPVTVQLTSDERGSAIVVRDGGMGIAREDQERIFGRFERAAPARNFPGLGLGLYHARQVVEACGGTVTVESEPGKGAAFTLRLPPLGADHK